MRIESSCCLFLLITGCAPERVVEIDYDPEAVLQSGLIITKAEITDIEIKSEIDAFNHERELDEAHEVQYKDFRLGAGTTLPQYVPNTVGVIGIYGANVIGPDSQLRRTPVRYEVMTDNDRMIIVYSLHNQFEPTECVTLALNKDNDQYPPGIFHGGNCNHIVFPCIPKGKVFTQSRERTDFRHAAWGMSCAQAKATEIGQLINQETDTLFYKDELAKLNVLVVYKFQIDQLIEAEYRILEEYPDKNQHIDDFFKLKALLTKKHGDPLIDDDIWKNNVNPYANSPHEWGEAISRGQLTFFAKWQTESTIIRMVLRGKNDVIHHYLAYASKAMTTRRGYIEELEALQKL